MNNIKEKIEQTRKALDDMIENNENGSKILNASIELDGLIEEYMELETENK